MRVYLLFLKTRANLPFDDEDLREYVETSSAKKVTKTKKNKPSSSNMPPLPEGEEHVSRQDAQPIMEHLADHKTSRVLKDNESTVSKRLRSPVRSGLLFGAKFDLYFFSAVCLRLLYADIDSFRGPRRGLLPRPMRLMLGLTNANTLVYLAIFPK